MTQAQHGIRRGSRVGLFNKAVCISKKGKGTSANSGWHWYSTWSSHKFQLPTWTAVGIRPYPEQIWNQRLWKIPIQKKDAATQIESFSKKGSNFLAKFLWAPPFQAKTKAKTLLELTVHSSGTTWNLAQPPTDFPPLSIWFNNWYNMYKYQFTVYIYIYILPLQPTIPK